MVKCEYCGKEYKDDQEMLEDCFISSDGWSWDYFHNCKVIEIHGYK
jgi:hypothetical protein